MMDTDIYLTIALIATGVGGILFLLSLLGIGDHDLDVHTDGPDGDAGDGGTHLLSVKSIIGFFLGVGWGGVFAQNMGWESASVLLTALLTGVCMFVITAMLIRMIIGLKSDGTLNYETLVGMTGTVYVSIPPNRQQGGQVTVAHPSQLLYLPALQDGDSPLTSGQQVRIESLVGNTVIVKALN